MDLKKLDTVAAADKGFEIQLFNPGDMSNLGIFITVLGRDSADYRKISSQHSRKRVQKMTKGNQFRMGSLTTEELESDTIELLAGVTKAWRDEGEKLDNQVLIDGVKYDCDLANAVMLYTRYPWIREQVDVAVMDRANFTQR